MSAKSRRQSKPGAATAGQRVPHRQPPSRLARLRDPAPGTEYPLILRQEPTDLEPAPWWRSLLGLMAALVLYALVVPLVALLVRNIGSLFSDLDRPEFLAQAGRYENAWGLAAGHLGIAMLIPLAVLVVAAIHRVHPRWLSSVAGRLRWSLLGWGLLVAAVMTAVVLVLTSLLEGGEVGGINPQPAFWTFLIPIVLITPFQAAAEEVFFRGYLLQSLGAFARTPWVGIITSSVAFALFHGVQNPALFADRLAFGLLVGILVWRTGGLELAIAAHVINNVFAFTVAGLTSSIAQARALQEITWGSAAIDVAGWVVVALALWGLAKVRRAEVGVAGAPTGEHR